MSSCSLFARRGMNVGGLVLVAPPDASARMYRDLALDSPPSTAPVTRGSVGSAPPSAFQMHARSASEVADGARARARLQHKGSRDVGIVGLSAGSTASESQGPASPASGAHELYGTHGAGLGVPVFQTPAKSRSPSPGPMQMQTAGSDLADDASAGPICPDHLRLLSTPIQLGSDDGDGLHTPNIGEPKDICQPVVGPVVVGLPPDILHNARNVAPLTRASPAAPSSPPSFPTSSPTTSSSSYLSYQPGVHATAGPLPPPPRSIFEQRDVNAPPPRPPRFHTPLPASTRRDIDAIKEALQLPHSVAAKLAARTPPAEEDKTCSPDLDMSPRLDNKEETRSGESVYSDESDSEQCVFHCFYSSLLVHDYPCA